MVKSSSPSSMTACNDAIGWIQNKKIVLYNGDYQPNHSLSRSSREIEK
jgi:hypothetical protein